MTTPAPAKKHTPAHANEPASRRWLADLLAGVSVALVLIPQSLAYAELAGLAPHHGLYAAAVAPLAAAFLASSPYLQTGPTAITSLLTLGALGAWTQDPAYYALMAALLALMVGAVRVGLGLARMGRLAFFLAPPVLKGFTVGAAVLIVASQLPIAVGVAPTGTGVLPRAFDALAHPELWHWPSIAVAATTLLVVVLGKRLHRLFPGVLVAALAGIAVSLLGAYDGATIAEVPAGFVTPSVALPWDGLPALLVPALVIALVGFAEPSAIARTYAAADRTRWDPDKELISQGSANVVAGLFGGLPVGGSFSRSAVNRLAGARTRWSGLITGLCVLAFLPLAWTLAPLPRPVLAAIIVGAVVKLLDWRGLFGIWRFSWPQGLIALTTFALTLALAPRVDLAVIIGLGLSLGRHAWREMRIRVVVTRTPHELRIAPSGVLWFASADALEQAFIEQLAAHPDDDLVVIDLAGLGRIDYAGATALLLMVRRAADGGRQVYLRRVPPHAHKIIGKVAGHLVDRRPDPPT